MVSYNRLWKLQIVKNLKKKDLMKLANLSSSSIVKLAKGQNITTDMLSKICEALQCDFGEIMEYSHDEPLKEANRGNPVYRTEAVGFY